MNTEDKLFPSGYIVLWKGPVPKRWRHCPEYEKGDLPDPGFGPPGDNVKISWEAARMITPEIKLIMKE